MGYLRGYRRFQAITAALRVAKERFGVRIIHFSVQGNHLHLLVEADNAQSLARGIQGLSIRLAKALNRLISRRGKVFADRYHAHVLETRREVAHALRYILENFRHHLREDVAPRGADPCSSAAWLTLAITADAPVVAARTWLLRHADSS
jgi:REP element-mobilizing transposase RayT